MNTKIFEPTEENLIEAAKIIAAGGLVAFPTETVYGLGADAMNPEAVSKVYAAKGRPSDNPMIVHVARASDIGLLTSDLSKTMVTLIDNFWPGPLTLIVKRKPNVPDVTTGGLDTVGVRMPDSDIARKIIEYSGCPIAAPSANLSGSPSPTRASHCIDDLDGRVDCIVKGPDCRVGIESTVLDITGEVPTILRPGIITAEQLEAALDSKVEYDASLFKRPDARPSGAGLDAGFSPDFKPKSPGMKYKHYAPKADMIIVEGARDRVESEIERLRGLNESLGNKVGVILFEEKAFIEAAHEFFADLREMDKTGVDLILAGALSDTSEVGFAVMNRMLKSAGYNIVKV